MPKISKLSHQNKSFDLPASTCSYSDIRLLAQLMINLQESPGRQKVISLLNMECALMNEDISQL